MNDTIYRQDAIDALKALATPLHLDVACEDIWERDRTLDNAINEIRVLPSVHPGIEKLTCSGCKWEFEIAKECEECARVMTDNYEKAKKKLTFSERQKIVHKFEEWCSSNDAANCAESFLAYLIVEGYIDG